MRWSGRRESDNVEYGSGGGGGNGKLIGGGIGTVVIAVIVYLLGGDPTQVLQQGAGEPQQQEQTYKKEEKDKDPTDRFIGVMLAETEGVWSEVFEEMGLDYRVPKLHVFEGTVNSACGYATDATGPFYCPGDEKVYLDKTFFMELKNKFHAPGDFANAYVIAHEVGHHVQKLLGTNEKFERMRQQMNKKEANKLSVMMELQADFYAGMWAHYASKKDRLIEDGDIDEALNAANAIGDDRLQQQAQGRVVPDAFTHGTSQQRMYWFRKGYETGDIKQGNTFEAIGGIQ